MCCLFCCRERTIWKAPSPQRTSQQVGFSRVACPLLFAATSRSLGSVPTRPTLVLPYSPLAYRDTLFFGGAFYHLRSAHISVRLPSRPARSFGSIPPKAEQSI